MTADALPANPQQLARRGLMFVMSSPSGAGKTTISRRLLATDAALTMSVSATTRPMRPGETDGVDYSFVDQPRFDEMVSDRAFLEYAMVFGNMYGTPRKQIVEGLDSGQDYLFDIDWQGTQQLKTSMPSDVTSVFLLPPSMDELRRRLTSRGTDSAEVVEARMQKAEAEISHYDAYDYVLINDDVETCLGHVVAILDAERQRITRQTGLIDFVRGLTQP